MLPAPIGVCVRPHVGVFTMWPPGASLKTHPGLSPSVWIGLLVLAGLALAWDVSGLDLVVMRWWGDGSGFALRHHPWLERYAHDGVRRVLLGLLLVGLVCLVTARGPARNWSATERLAVGLGVLGALLVVNLIKRASLTSCPWDLAEFGGPARYVSHWMWGVADGGGAHCFPGGHASSSLAFVGVALPWLGAGDARRRTGIWVALVVLLAGAGLGAVQTLRGAHNPSHTLWTMVICGATSVAIWWAVHVGSARRTARRSASYQPSPM